MSVKLGMVGALGGWGGRGRRPSGAPDRSGPESFLCMVFCKFFVLSWANPPPTW